MKYNRCKICGVHVNQDDHMLLVCLQADAICWQAPDKVPILKSQMQNLENYYSWMPPPPTLP